MGTEVVKHQRKCLNDKAVKELVFAIFSQAINDYRNLRISSFTNKEDKKLCTRQKIEKFFNGSWCQELLDGLNINMNGKDILHKIKSESINLAKYSKKG